MDHIEQGELTKGKIRNNLWRPSTQETNLLVNQERLHPEPDKQDASKTENGLAEGQIMQDVFNHLVF